METKRLKRKRRPVGGCTNPLFVKWVEEWRDQAREEGSKVQYAYTKALNSLKKYPLPLTSGEEAKILDHIGEKLAKKLDKRLAQYRAEEEGSVKRSKVAAGSLAGGHGAQGDVQSAKGKRKRSQTEYVPEFRSGPYAIIIALYRAKQRPNWTGHLTKNQLMSQAQAFSDKSFTIPDDGKYYTAWSSVTTLIRKGLVDKRSCPAKFRLTEAGEEMAEKLERATSSLTSPSSVLPSANHSSSSLAASNSNRAGNGPRVSPTQNIVSRPMSPPTFSPPYPSLKSPNTPTPPDLSHPPTISLVSDTEDSSSSSDIEILPPPLSVRIQAKTGPTNTTSLSLSPSPPHTQGPSCHQRWCVEETPEHSVACGSGERLPTGSGGREPLTPAHMAGRAALSRIQSGGVASGVGGDRGEGKSSDGGRKGESSWKRKESRGERSKGKFPSGRVDLTLEREDFSVGKKRRESIDDDDDLPDFPLLSRAKPPQTHRPTLTSPPPKSPPFQRSPSSPLSPSSPSIPKSTLSKPVLRDVTTSRTQNVSSNTTATTNTTSKALTTGPPLFRLKPGEFEVVLCVDNAESTACRKSSSQFRGILLQDLAKNGVRFDVRKLNVGDFLWIAKEKSSPLRGQVTLPSSREVVLDYIVERKRMDDLAGSITDGRFNEQKFRLKNCGVKCPIYLVEEFGDKMHLKLPVRSLEQAISNTLVIDGFTVQRTTDIRDSVVYLTLLTRQLSTHYAEKTVEAYPWNVVADVNKPPPPAGDRTGRHGSHLTVGDAVHGVEFASFNDASVKNKTLTAYEMLGRHLIQVPCVSAERAAAILDHFPTISALRDAYEKCGTSTEREALVSRLKAGQSRSMGKTIGSILSRLYWGQ
jgi:ERCC4-type nuclease